MVAGSYLLWVRVAGAGGRGHATCRHVAIAAGFICAPWLGLAQQRPKPLAITTRTRVCCIITAWSAHGQSYLTAVF